MSSRDTTDLQRRLRELRRDGPSQPEEQPVWHPDAETTRPELYEVRRRLHAKVAQELGPVLYDQNLDPDRLSSLVREHLTRLLRHEPTPMSATERKTLMADIESDILGHGPIEEFLRDPDVTEIMVNGPDEIYVARGGRLFKTNGHFADQEHLRSVVDTIVARVGRRVDEASPMVDARLPDGSRVNAVIHPLAIGGPFLTIRKFSAEPLTDRDLIRFGTMTPTVADFLRLSIEGRVNVLISGERAPGRPRR